jgi:hypothetical protein
MDMGLAYPAAAQPSTQASRDSGAEPMQVIAGTNRPGRTAGVKESVVEFMVRGTNSARKRLTISLAAL